MGETNLSKSAKDIDEKPENRHVPEPAHETPPSKKPLRASLVLQRSGGNCAVNALLGIEKPLQSRGQALAPEVQAYMESIFRWDFSGVRLHRTAQAAQSALDINADAYTMGTDIVFAPGKYGPTTFEGKQLLAHELAHVVQQDRAGGKRSATGIAPEGPFEANADHAGNAAAAGKVVQAPLNASPRAVQRKQRRRDPYAYTNARLEARRLLWALGPTRSREIRVRALSRFHGFSHRQLIEMMRIWRQVSAVDLPGLVEVRVNRNWARTIRKRLQDAERAYQGRRATEYRRETAQRQRRYRRRALRFAQRELSNPTTPLGHFLKRRYPKLSSIEQRSVQGLLFFVEKQRRAHRGWLRPGRQYGGLFGNRWYLGKTSGRSIWMDESLRVYSQSAREEMFEALRRGIASAEPWVPILKGIAIFATIVVGGVVAAPAGAAGAVGSAVGRTGVAVGRVGLAASRAAVSALGGELALAGGVLRIVGSRALAFYLTNPVVVNEIGLFSLGLIVSVEGNIPALVRAVARDPKQALPIALEVLILRGTIRAGNAPARQFSARARVLPPKQQTERDRTRLQIIDKPRIKGERPTRPSAQPGIESLGKRPPLSERGTAAREQWQAQRLARRLIRRGEKARRPEEEARLGAQLQSTSEAIEKSRVAPSRRPTQRGRRRPKRRYPPSEYRTLGGTLTPEISVRPEKRVPTQPPLRVSRIAAEEKGGQATTKRARITERTVASTGTRIAPTVLRRRTVITPTRPAIRHPAPRTRPTDDAAVRGRLEAFRARRIWSRILDVVSRDPQRRKHAEIQTIVRNPNQPVEVSRPMCPYCIAFFRAEARFQRRR